MRESGRNIRFFFFVYILLLIVWGMFVLAGIQAHAEESKSQIESQIREIAVENGVDPSLAIAVAKVESSLNPNAVGSLGEIGLFQLRPEFYPVKRGNVRHNIKVAIKLLKRLQVQCRRYGDAFFVCYNSGPYRKIKHPRQLSYYRKVRAAQSQYSIQLAEAN